jgi:hypothetical protein
MIYYVNDIILNANMCNDINSIHKSVRSQVNMLKYTVRCLSSVGVVARPTPTIMSMVPIRRPLSPVAATSTPAVRGITSWFKTKLPEVTDNSIPDEKDHAKGILANPAGILTLLITSYYHIHIILGAQ